MRLYLREVVDEVRGQLLGLHAVLLDRAEETVEVLLPGYTHLQKAQPVRLAHHLMAYYQMFSRDEQRLAQLRERVDVMPLGAGAIAGSGYPVDRSFVAKLLGFSRVALNSMDAVSDRDFILEFLFNASVLMMHLSRLSEELVIWSSQEYGFIRISDAFCTGSSIMPQKKNPDLPELIRGKTGRVYGSLMGLLTTMKGLPLTYNKDMQEDKEALFDACDTVCICLEVMARLLGEITFNGERLQEAVQGGFIVATDLADYLVRKGLTFRQAHEIVGKMVLLALEQNKELHQLTLSEMKGFNRQIEEDVYQWLDPRLSPSRRKGIGGTAPDRVGEEIEKAKQELRGEGETGAASPPSL